MKGDYVMNQEHDRKNDIETQIADLPLTDEQAAETTAGGGSVALLGPPANIRVGSVDR
jgi:hypothetical protein